MDVIEENVGFWPTLQAFVIHLSPTVVLMVVLVLAWRHEWNRSARLLCNGARYLVWVMIMQRPVPAATRLGWTMMIAGPIFLIAKTRRVARFATLGRTSRRWT